MAEPIQNVLGHVRLLGLIEAIKNEIPDPLPDAFRNLTEQTLLDQGRYTQVKGQRRLSKTTRYRSPAIREDLKDVESKPVKLMHSFEEIVLPPEIFAYLRGYTDYEVDKGKQELARQVKLFTTRFANFRVASRISAMFKQNIWLDGDGELLPSSSGAVETLTYDAFTATTAVGSWDTTSTAITTQLLAEKKQAVRDTGFPIRHAYYGENIPHYFADNDTFKEFLARNSKFRDQFVDTGEIPDGIAGLQWHPCYENFFEDESGSIQSFVGADAIVFGPDVDTNTYGLLEGSYEVPTSLGPFADGVAAMNSFTQVFGMGAFALIETNPPGVLMRAFDTLLPVFKVPNSYRFKADVTAAP